MDQITNTLEDLFKKLPSLPKNTKEVIVANASILNYIVIALTAYSLVMLFGFSSYFSTFASLVPGHSLFGFTNILAIAFLAISLVLFFKAIPGLKNRKIDGWNMMFYALLVELIYSFFSGNLIGQLFGTAIGLYFLFQVKEYYKK
jgi:cation transport ATPase